MIVKVASFKVDSTKVPADIDRTIGHRAAEAEGIAPERLRDFRIVSRSIDARRGHPMLLYALELDIDSGDAAADFHAAPVLELPQSRLCGPIVVGTGPAGIFAALALAMAGAKPLVIDRGQPIPVRYATYRRFLDTRELDEEDNLLIGEGGAGTFSDGKLYTGTRDARSTFILHKFAEAGAPPEIRYLKRPHIGSDRLRKVAIELRNEIVKLGGEFRFGTGVAELLIRDGRCAGVVTTSGERLEAPQILIAPGLGGRSLVRRIANQGAAYMLKPFQIGCRIEHPQEFLDRSLYHVASRPAALGAAEYHLVSRSGNGVSGVSSFCMCPGGEILNATAWRGQSVTNGMSDCARSGEFGNGCLITTLEPEKFGSPDAAYGFLEALERRMFKSGGGNYGLPAQDAAAFLAGRAGLTQTRTSARVGVIPARLDELVPGELTAALRAALRNFDRANPGFVRYGKFLGLETCVSSPLRFLRDAETLESTIPGLYLGGEGAGAAGGIMSAAVDGLRIAEAMLKK